MSQHHHFEIPCQEAVHEGNRSNGRSKALIGKERRSDDRNQLRDTAYFETNLDIERETGGASRERSVRAR